MARTDPPTVVFDLGGVLVDWNPRYLYTKIFDGDEEKMEWFLGTVATPDWNLSFDAGRPMAEGIAEKSALHPEHADTIAAWQARWREMIRGPIEGTVSILEALDAHGVALHAITNWSAETFPIAREMFPFLTRFRTITVSGEVGLIKPGREIFDHFVETTGVRPDGTIFTDDSHANIAAAEALGFDAIHFSGPDGLARDLKARIPSLAL